MNIVTKFAVFALLFLVCSTNIVFSQNIPVGHWRDHLPYNQIISVAVAEDVAYAVSKNSMFSYNKKDFSITTISKINGLSDVGFEKIAYHDGLKALVIAYSNANIDIIKNGRIINLPDIKNKNLPINKTINNITLIDNEAWLSCGFGIVVINLEREEFKDTYLIGDLGSFININDIKFYNDTVYAATDNGIFRAATDDFLPYFDNWNRWNDIPYPLEKYNTLGFFNDIAYINLKTDDALDDTIFYNDNGVWKHFVDGKYQVCEQIDVFGSRLLITYSDNVVVYNDDMTLYRHIFDYDLGGPDAWGGVVSKEAVIDNEGFLWIADRFGGLVFIYDQWAYKNIFPNGPGSSKSFHMASVDNELWVASGAYDNTWSMTFNKGDFYYFDGFRWRSYNAGTTPALDTIYDIVCVAIDPNDPTRVFAGTWDKGLLYFKNGKLEKIYDETNSSLSVLENPALGLYRVAIGGLAFDNDGNLWVTNSGVSRSLSVLKRNGNWHSFNISSSGLNLNDRVLGKVAIDRIGQKWVIVGRGHGIQVFNDNNTIENTNDDKTTNITNILGRGNLPSTLINDIAFDRDGRLWIGSDNGVAVIYSPESVFTGFNYDAQRIIVNIDGFDQYLLDNINVMAIAVDGANRKWIGTERSGVFLLSPDGTEQLKNFNVDNSPLPDNGIRSIEVNHLTGEVFFGTNRGIISYRSDATRTVEPHSDIKVFPNPVKPGYDGAIVVSGLVQDADVKITNISGDVVFVTRAAGGSVSWYGNDISGNRVATGVYLVFSADQTGEETAVAKIVFIR